MEKMILKYIFELVAKVLSVGESGDVPTSSVLLSSKVYYASDSFHLVCKKSSMVFLLPDPPGMAKDHTFPHFFGTLPLFFQKVFVEAL